MNHDANIALQIDRLMRRFHADMHPRAVRVDQEKIGPVGGMILLAIDESSPIALQVLANRLGRDKSQISRIVQTLVRKGLVEKAAHDEDARVSELTVTEKGNLQIAGFRGALVETTRNILGPLDRDEADQFSKLLSKILNAPGEADVY